MSDEEHNLESSQPQPPPLPPARAVSRLRWWCYLILLTSYPIVLGLIAASYATPGAEPMLPQNTGRLLLVSLGELFFFGLVFGLAWLLSRVTPGQLRLTWRGTIAPVVRGFAYSIALRIVVAIGVVLAFAILHVVVGTPEGGVKASMPRVDAIVDPAALSKDPVYLILMLTLVSFVVAGLREELWRAGMLAGFETLFPNMFQSRTGAMLAVTLIAVAFGLGHLIQGWIAVGVATLLGIGLGAIILIHRSIWDAVLAHGFFDATTFALLCLVGRFAPDLFPGK